MNTNIRNNKDVYSFVLQSKGDKSEKNISDPSGVIYDTNSFPGLLPSQKLEYDIEYMEKHGDGFRAGSYEWWAFSLACILANDNKITPTICELGASQGLWCASWVSVLSKNKVKNIYALAIEASNGLNKTIEFWNNQNLDFNVLKSELYFSIENEYLKFDWINRAVSSNTGTLKFPDVDMSTNNGAAIDNMMNHNISGFIEVQSITPEEILNKSGKVGFLHIDIQGEELSLLRVGSLGDLVKESSVVVIGTHSVESDQELIPYMESLDMVMVRCSESRYNDNGELSWDGEQIWLSRDVFEYSLLNKYIIAELDPN